MKHFRHQKKAIVKDFVTGKEYVLKSARYTKNRKECAGGCKADGRPRSHDSGEEAGYCEKLGIMQKVGVIKSYEAQKTFYLHNRECGACGSMRVDFVVTLPDGREQCREYKGNLFGKLREFHLARALFSYCYPDVEYLTVTERDLL